ncbi:hypothetical protein [uncultured Methylobacterium sp.]|uniref:hypothetical protein n=1 Tax=uncultured Methylobacterium sp. TaxID=157278 RepID=UPI0035CB55FD
MRCRDEPSGSRGPPSKSAEPSITDYGVVASFSRALVEGLTVSMSDGAFDPARREWRQRSQRPRSDDRVFPNRRGGYEGHDNMVKRRFLPLFQKLTERHAEEPDNRPPPARFNVHVVEILVAVREAKAAWQTREQRPKSGRACVRARTLGRPDMMIADHAAARSI